MSPDVICKVCKQSVTAVTSAGTCSLCALVAKLEAIHARNQSFADLWKQHVERINAAHGDTPRTVGDPHEIVGLWINGFYMHVGCRVDRRHHAPAPDGVIFRQDLLLKSYTCSRCQRPLGR